MFAGAPAWVVRLAGLVLFVAVCLPVIREAGSRLAWLATTALLALFVSFVLEPVVDRLSARGLRRGGAAAVALFAVVAPLAVCVTLIGSLLLEQSRVLLADLPAHMAHLEQFLGRRGVDVDIESMYQRARDRLEDRAVDMGGSALSAVGQVVTVGFFGFYFAVDGPRLRRQLCSVLPPHRQRVLLRVWDLAIEKTGEFILSRLALATLSALVHSTVFWAIGLPSPVPLGIFVGLVSQAIPSFGTYVAAAPPLLVAFAVSPGTVVAVLIAVVVYQQLENYLLVPKVQRHLMDVHPAVGLAATIAGVSLLGVPGALLALPVTATVQAFVSSYTHRYDLVDSPSLVTGQLRSTASDDGAAADADPSSSDAG